MRHGDNLLCDARYREGIALFNHAHFLECHEVLEAIWTLERGPRRMFLQSLIHFAVAFHHYSTGNTDGARRQFSKALQKMAGYLPEYGGIDTWRLYTDGTRWKEALNAGVAIDESPKLLLLEGVQSQVRK